MPKKLFFIVLVILAIIISTFLILNISKEEVYSDEPEKWVEAKPGGVNEIIVEEITEGEGFIDSLGQQYRSEKATTVFDYEGFYKGDYFKREYMDEDGNILMRINAEMKPNDGIIEGFIVEKIEDNKPIVYIFLDSDWKEKLGKTNIFWGMSYENNKEFEFNEVSDGVYMDSIEDDISRLAEDFTLHLGGIIVGNIDEEKIETKDPDVTLIRFI